MLGSRARRQLYRGTRHELRCLEDRADFVASCNAPQAPAVASGRWPDIHATLSLTAKPPRYDNIIVNNNVSRATLFDATYVFSGPGALCGARLLVTLPTNPTGTTSAVIAFNLTNGEHEAVCMLKRLDYGCVIRRIARLCGHPLNWICL